MLEVLRANAKTVGEARKICLGIYEHERKRLSGDDDNRAVDESLYQVLGTSSATMDFYDLVDPSIGNKIVMFAESRLPRAFWDVVCSTPAKKALAVVWSYVVTVFYYLDLAKDIYIAVRHVLSLFMKLHI